MPPAAPQAPGSYRVVAELDPGALDPEAMERLRQGEPWLGLPDPAGASGGPGAARPRGADPPEAPLPGDPYVHGPSRIRTCDQRIMSPLL